MSVGLYVSVHLYVCVWQVQIRQCVPEHLLCMCTCLGLYTRSGLYTCMRLNTCLCVWQVQMQIHKGEKNTQKTVAYIRDQGWVRAVALFPPACRSSVLSTNSSAVTAHSAFLFPTTASPRPL